MRFAKLHGAGNDYIYMDARGVERGDWGEIAQAVSDRHFGIGSDGLILLRESDIADARMQMFNSDGSEGMMCGNGIRCFARFGLDENALETGKSSFIIETASGALEVRPIWRGGEMSGASVSMGAPILDPPSIPVVAPDGAKTLMNHPIAVGGAEFPISCVSMGNPHAVHFLESAVEDYPLTEIGPLVERHPMFPDRVNYEIVNVLSRDRIRVRVWERGSGITLACGTGACAAVVAGRLNGFLGDSVAVELPGGELRVHWNGEGEVILEGPIAKVFEGEWGDWTPKTA